MISNKTLILLAEAICLSFLLLPSDAHAYLDPGTGSILLQLLAAGVLGCLFTIKSWWRSVKAFILRLFGSKKE